MSSPASQAEWRRASRTERGGFWASIVERSALPTLPTARFRRRKWKRANLQAASQRRGRGIAVSAGHRSYGRVPVVPCPRSHRRHTSRNSRSLEIVCAARTRQWVPAGSDARTTLGLPVLFRRRRRRAWWVRRRKDRALADPLPYVDGFEAGFGFHRKRIGLSGLTGRIFESFFTNGYAVSSALAELPRNGLRNSAAEANCRRVFGYRASKSVVSIRNGIMYMITLPMTLPPTPVPCAL